MQSEYDRVLDYLKQLRDGKLQLPDVADSYEMLPFLSNLTMIGAAHTAKVRVLPSVSVGQPPAPESGRKHYTAPNDYPFFF